MITVDRTDMNHILSHMGHSWDIHRDYYRQYSPVVERLDVAKLLLMQDRGLVGENRKKKISDIQVEDLTRVELQDLLQNEDEGQAAAGDEGQEVSFEETYQPHPYGYEVDGELFQKDEPQERRTRKKHAVIKHKWTESEKTELRKRFKSCFAEKRIPQGKEIKATKQDSKQKKGHIYKHTESMIKNMVRRMILASTNV